MTLTRDISGQAFGKLTALSIVDKYRRESVWECRCACGKLVRVRLSNLRTGNSKSCGCLREKPHD